MIVSKPEWRFKFSLVLIFALPSVLEGGVFRNCYHLFRGTDFVGLTVALEESGYTPSVTQRLIDHYPVIAEKIRRLSQEGNKRESEPVTLYRGLKIRWKEYRPRFLVKNGRRNDIYMGDEDLAVRWATVAGKDDTIVLELQVPRFLIHLKNRIPGVVSTVRTKDIPDLTPLILRVGTVTSTNSGEVKPHVSWPLSPKQIEWKFFEEMP